MNRVYESMTPAARIERARAASAASHSVEATAAKLVRDLPAASPEQQQIVRAMLRPVIVRKTGRGSTP